MINKIFEFLIIFCICQMIGWIVIHIVTKSKKQRLKIDIIETSNNYSDINITTRGNLAFLLKSLAEANKKIIENFDKQTQHNKEKMLCDVIKYIKEEWDKEKLTND